jgi:hypothetical protein
MRTYRGWGEATCNPFLTPPDPNLRRDNRRIPLRRPAAANP